jgi:hypothetical protein
MIVLGAEVELSDLMGKLFGGCIYVRWGRYCKWMDIVDGLCDEVVRILQHEEGFNETNEDVLRRPQTQSSLTQPLCLRK